MWKYEVEFRRVTMTLTNSSYQITLMLAGVFEYFQSAIIREELLVGYCVRSCEARSVYHILDVWYRDSTAGGWCLWLVVCVRWAVTLWNIITVNTIYSRWAAVRIQAAVGGLILLATYSQEWFVICSSSEGRSAQSKYIGHRSGKLCTSEVIDTKIVYYIYVVTWKFRRLRTYSWL